MLQTFLFAFILHSFRDMNRKNMRLGTSNLGQFMVTLWVKETLYHHMTYFRPRYRLNVTNLIMIFSTPSLTW